MRWQQSLPVTLGAMVVDLHTHTTFSDGALMPAELGELVRSAGVEIWSITDHDTLGAYADLASADGIHLVPGVELSATWSGRGVHIVGLNIDLDSPDLQDMTRRQLAARERRATLIAERLERRGLAIDLDSIRRAADGHSIGRPHFANALVASGQVRDVRTAFRKYLGPGKPGDVKSEWPALPNAVQAIRAAGGTAVLAHPGKYRLTRSRLRCLADDFKAAGGRAIEVVCGPQEQGLTRHLAELALDRGFDVSVGSDFHAPLPWSRPGVSADAIKGCSPVWDRW